MLSRDLSDHVLTLTCTHSNWESLAAVRVLTDKGDHIDVAFEDPAYDPEKLRKAGHLARWVTLFLFVRFALPRAPTFHRRADLSSHFAPQLALFIIWPLSMYGSAYIFSRQVRSLLPSPPVSPR